MTNQEFALFLCEKHGWNPDIVQQLCEAFKDIESEAILDERARCIRICDEIADQETDHDEDTETAILTAKFIREEIRIGA